MRMPFTKWTRLPALIASCALLMPAASNPAALAKPAGAAIATVSVTPSVPAGRYVVGQPIAVTVSQSNPGGIARTFTRVETLTDYFGDATSLLTDTVTLAAGGTSSDAIAVPITGAGYFEVHVTLTDQASNQQVSAFTPIGVIRPQPSGLDPSSGLGINGNLTQGYGSDGQAMATAATAMAAAGIRYDREELNWQTIEPKPGSGQFDFARTDAAIVAAHNAGIHVLGLVAYWGNLPQPDTTRTISGTTLINTITGCSKGPVCAYTPAGDKLFAAYAAATVNHYKPGGALAQQQGWTDGYGITDWEVWNEPSTISFWRHDLAGYQGLFAALYKAASTSMYKADPAAHLMYTESGPTIDAAVKATDARSDIAAVHSYSGGLDPDAALASPNLPRGGQGTAPAAIGAIVAQGQPVWVTETGYPTDGTVTGRQQADYLVRSYVDFLAQGVKKNFWFKFREDAPGGDNLYGITSQNGAPKPAYIAYATMARHLQDATFAQSVQLGTAVRAALFSRPDGATEAMLWGLGENGSILVPSTAGATVTADDITDNPVGQIGPAGLTVPLTGDPVFVTVAGETPNRLAAALQHTPIAGINAVGVLISQAPGLVNGLPSVKVTISARIDVPISGTVTLALPVGWTTPHTALRFATLQPGQSSTLSFRLNAEVSHIDDRIGATAVTTTGLSNTGAAPVTPYALTYGHPVIDGTLGAWQNASVANLIDLRPDQIVGIPGWTPQNLSARVYTMWDEQYFYLAADVTDMTFDYAPIGYNMYKGDSIQYGWGMDPNAWLRDAGNNRFNVTTGLTHQGPANFQYNLLGPWMDMKQDIKLDPATGHLIYTTAVPWSRLGGYTPKIGNQFAFNLIVNQNENGNRIGWIQFSPGIGIGFRPSQWPLWTIIGSNPAAGVRLGGLVAPNLATASFSLPNAKGLLVIHNGGMRSIQVAVNGVAIPFGPGGAALKQFGDTSLDISKYVRAGMNAITANAVGASRASAAVLSFFQ